MRHEKRPGLERRNDHRVQVDMFLNQYIRDFPFRAVMSNLSSSGLLIQKLVEPRIELSKVVSVEFEIPGTGEWVWARAEPRFDALEENFHTTGLTFTAMAQKHERMLREFVLHKRESTSRWRTAVRAKSFIRSPFARVVS